MFIKMCEKAEKIQRAWKPQLGDWFYSKEVDDAVQILGFTKESRRVIDKGIWLPTQEQLQEMIDWDKAINNSTNIINNTWKRECREGLKLYLLYDFYRDGISNRFDTIKEIMLAFVMKEKYNKIWNGEDWELTNQGN